ncbi:MAG: hypothetical protein ACR2I2_03580 [Bryobacteraceae bacterium]
MDLEERMDRLDARLETLVGIVEGLANVFEEAQRKNEERFAKMADAQTRLDETLGVLMKTRDEWIRNGRH